MRAAWSDTADRPPHAKGGRLLTSPDDLPVDHHLEELLDTFAARGSDPQVETLGADAATA